MLKKTLALLLAVLLLAVTFSGCDSRKSNPTINVTNPPHVEDPNAVKLPDKYTVEIDHTLLPESLAKLISRNDIVLYKNAVRAFLDFEPSVTFPENTNPDLVVNLLVNYCPVLFSSLDASGILVNTETSQIEFTYLSEDKKSHDEAVKSFTQKVLELIGELDTSYPDRQVALLIYHRLVSKIDAVSNALEEISLKDLSGYGALIGNIAHGSSVASALSFLYTQTGIDNVTVLAEQNNSKLFLNLITVEGQRYYCDTSADLVSDSLSYFGMNDVSCAEGGYTALAFPFSANDVVSTYPANGSLFDEFRNGAECIEFQNHNDLLIYENYIGEKWNFFFDR